MSIGLSPKEQLIHELTEVIDSYERRKIEQQAILDQNRLEVDRLEQRTINISTQLRRVEEQFDSIPRQDIKVAYEDAMDARTKLAGMRGRLEKLEDNHRHLQETADLLKNIREMVQGAQIEGRAVEGGPVGFKMSLAGEQIVRIVEAQEAERQRLATALHDGPAQSLTNFILQAEICQRLFDRDPDRASVELNNLKSAASTSFQKVRDFIFDLRPMMLDDLGLVPTMRRYAEQISEKEGSPARISFALTGAERRLPKHVEVMCFRTIQVLINNSRDILKATQITIKLDIGDETLTCSVEDNGRGFDPAIVLDRSQGDSPLQNLLDLRERIELVGGRLEAFSQEGEASSVEIRIPFSNNG